MRKVWIALFVIVAVGGAIWYFAGGTQRVTERRVRTVLTDKGVPPVLAACMAKRMANELTIGQLRALEKLAPREGEPAVPRLPGEAMKRIERVGDPQAVRITMRAGVVCALGNLQ